jgi:hypothetical protein
MVVRSAHDMAVEKSEMVVASMINSLCQAIVARREATGQLVLSYQSVSTLRFLTNVMYGVPSVHYSKIV